MEASIQTEINSSCKQGKANKGMGRKDWAGEGLRKGDPSCQMAEAAERTNREEGVTWGVGEVPDREGHGYGWRGTANSL